MTLSAQTIRRICDSMGMITPFHEKTVADGMSYGLSAAGYDVRIDQPLDIYPNSFRLGSTAERFVMPMDVIGIVCDKSSWARQGIAVQNTVIEPGWRGYLTLEISNHNPYSIVNINRYSPIAQIIFHRLDEPTELPYVGKYQNQQRGPQPAKYE